jgi:hypothetical protein
MRLVSLVGLVLAALLIAPAAQAKGNVDAEVKRLANESHQKYQAGDYAGAAETLLQAYELKPVSTLLFNIAKTYEKAGNDDQAIRFYQRYIDAADAEPEQVRVSSRAIERLRLADEEKKRAAQAESDKKAAEQKAEADKLAAQKAQLEQQEHDRQVREQAQADARAQVAVAQPAPKRSRALPYTLIGVGGAAVLGGGVLGLTAKGLANDEKASTDPVAKPDLRSQAKSRALVADIAYGIGAAALVTGIVLIATEPKAAPAEGSASLTPRDLVPQVMVLDHGAGLAWGGAL